MKKVKLNLLSSRLYLSEFLLFNFFILGILILLENRIAILIPLIFLIFTLSLIYFYQIGEKRNKEVEEISKTIHSIRKNELLDSSEIRLGKHLRKLEDEIKEMFIKNKNDIEYLEKLEKIRTEFLGNVSHELRNPIFAIQGYIETLLDGAIDDPQVNKHFLQKANEHTINLSNLLNDLIDISMIESGEMRLSFRYFEIHGFLSEIANQVKPIAEDKNLELIYHPCRENLKLYGDKNRLKQALDNLITNAIKYTEKGKVEILVNEERSTGRIIIRDTGIGIHEDDLSRIFERFYRVDKARSREVGGTGLGLAIVKHIIEAHGSKIYVKSKLGEGSEFSFALKK
ncbi:MAG: ATP-binding protein [Ignavibacteriaceae bacterium]|nr:ATP-binding protein [Ignavibacteriaceae bacterium]